MTLLAAVVLVALAVFPGPILVGVSPGWSAVASAVFLLVAVLVLVGSLRSDAARWRRIVSSLVATAATLLWLNWAGLLALRWLADQ